MSKARSLWVYTKGTFLFLLTCAEFGLIAPYLMSQSDSLANFFGIMSIIIYFPIAGLVGISFAEDLETEFKHHEVKEDSNPSGRPPHGSHTGGVL